MSALKDYWSKPSNTPDVNDPNRTFRVTHPFHPFYGREFALIAYRCNWGNQRVFFNDDNGRMISLPVQWTSILPPDPFVVLSAGRSAFRATDLSELARMVDELQSGDKL